MIKKLKNFIPFMILYINLKIYKHKNLQFMEFNRGFVMMPIVRFDGLLFLMSLFVYKGASNENNTNSLDMSEATAQFRHEVTILSTIKTNLYFIKNDYEEWETNKRNLMSEILKFKENNENPATSTEKDSLLCKIKEHNESIEKELNHIVLLYDVLNKNHNYYSGEVNRAVLKDDESSRKASAYIQKIKNHYMILLEECEKIKGNYSGLLIREDII